MSKFYIKIVISIVFLVIRIFVFDASVSPAHGQVHQAPSTAVR
jgi:hypothetical protein